MISGKGNFRISIKGGNKPSPCFIGMMRKTSNQWRRFHWSGYQQVLARLQSNPCFNRQLCKLIQRVAFIPIHFCHSCRPSTI